MTRDDIIKMAREANRYANNQTGDSYEWHFIRDERFAALVAAAERNAILQMSREQWFKTQADFEEAIRAREKQE